MQMSDAEEGEPALYRALGNAACNIGLLLRRQTGVGTPRSLQGRALSAIYGLIGRWRGCWERLRRVWGLNRSMLHLEAA